LAGLLDSDGHYLIQSNGYEITQNNKFLVQQIKYLCDSLGFSVSINAKKASIRSTGFESTVYRLRIYGDIDRIPVKINYKSARAWASPVDWRVSGISIEQDIVDDYYGFEIDGNHLFLLEDMTVTHNTSFTLAITKNAALDFNQGVAFFSLEMSSVQLVNRIISMETQIESEKLRKGRLEDYEWQQLYAVVDKLANVPIFIDDTPGISIFELRAKCRRLKMQHDIKMIIIDYLQLMTAGGDGKNGNREQEISAISRSLKALAKELSVPVIALSQLSRAVETRGGSKRPQLSDLRESGAIEQDADIVSFIYRPEYYQILEDEDGNSLKGIGEIIIAKHRNGALEDVRLKWDGQYALFSNLDDDAFQNFSQDDFGSNLNNNSNNQTFNSKLNNPGNTDDVPF
jgi:replicative DNA helicase